MGIEDGEWVLVESHRSPVASFVPTEGGRASVVPLDPAQTVFLNRRKLSCGLSYRLRPGDRVRVADVTVRISGTSPATAAWATWGPAVVLLGLLGLGGYIALGVAGTAESGEETEQAPVGIEVQRRILEQAFNEARGLERLRAYSAAAKVLTKVRAEIRDSELVHDLDLERVRLVRLAQSTSPATTLSAPLDEPPEVDEAPVDEPPAVDVEEPEDDPAPAVEQSEDVPEDSVVEAPPPDPPVGQATPRPAADDFYLRVNTGIDRAVERLQTTALAPERPGEAALFAFALLRSGVDPADPTLETLFAGFADVPLSTTYDLSVAILALEARSIERLSQPPFPGTRSVAQFRKHDIPATDLERMTRFAEQLVAGQGEGGDWGYPCPAPGERLDKIGLTDNSNTQFAVLALHAAERSGVHVPAGCWRGVFEHFVNTVKPPKSTPLETLEFNANRPTFIEPGTAAEPGSTRLLGQAQGWGYRAIRGVEPAMTAGGLSSLVIAADALERAEALGPVDHETANLLAHNAAQWLARRFNPRNRIDDWKTRYYFYSLEKAMEVSGIESLKGVAWYRALATELLRRQASHGGWESDVDTSLALLVLNRATLHLGGHGTRVRGTAAATTRVLEVKVRGKEVDLPGRLALLATLETPRKEISLLGAAIRKLPEAQRPRLVAALAKLLESPKSVTQRFATKQLLTITGERLDPAGYLAWGQRYSRIHAARVPLRSSAEHAVVEVLESSQGGPLFSAAVLASVRTRAIHLVPNLVDALWRVSGEEHQEACSALRGLCGVDPAADSPSPAQAAAAWRGWLSSNHDALQQRAWIEAFVSGGTRAQEARLGLLKLGRVVVPDLLLAFESQPDASWIDALLAELTGLTAAPTPGAWRKAWEESQR